MITNLFGSLGRKGLKHWSNHSATSEILLAKDAETKKLMNDNDKKRKRILLLKKTETTKLIMEKDTGSKKVQKNVREYYWRRTL